MSIHQIRVHGATNTRRGFLDPLFDPLIASHPEAPSTIGEVMGRLQIANAKLSGLRGLTSKASRCIANLNQKAFNRTPRSSLCPPSKPTLQQRRMM